MQIKQQEVSECSDSTEENTAVRGFTVASEGSAAQYAISTRGRIYVAKATVMRIMLLRSIKN